jgi:hypothetical protein
MTTPGCDALAGSSDRRLVGSSPSWVPGGYRSSMTTPSLSAGGSAGRHGAGGSVSAAVPTGTDVARAGAFFSDAAVNASSDGGLPGSVRIARAGSASVRTPGFCRIGPGALLRLGPPKNRRAAFSTAPGSSKPVKVRWRDVVRSARSLERVVRGSVHRDIRRGVYLVRFWRHRHLRFAGSPDPAPASHRRGSASQGINEGSRDSPVRSSLACGRPGGTGGPWASPRAPHLAVTADAC